MAQSTTEEGIRALLRGEYQAAARILRPLAEDPAQPDPVAQFFLAFLYDTGHGVGADPLRACGLFLSAARRVHPFTEQAVAIAALKREQLEGAASLFCVADESWQGGPPQAFVLGHDHRIVFADTSISLRHGDREWRMPMVLPVGTAYLPIRYTPLDVTRPTGARRHFFQWFTWTPDTTLKPSAWTLGWVLSEVAGDDWTPVAHEKSLAIVNGTTWPASYDVANFVRLLVNANGEAQFTIQGPTVSRTEVIPWPESR